jgi:L-fucose isomerase
MLLGHLLTDSAQLFCDVRTYWSPEAVKRVTGHKLKGISENGFIHLINSGSACLDWTGQQSINSKPAIKPYWDITSEEVKKCLSSTLFRPAIFEYFRGGGFSTNFLTKSGMPVTMSRINLINCGRLCSGYTQEC